MSDHAGLALGIDIGGTFTDIVVLDLADGRSWSHKELTTHVDPADGVLSGVRHVAAAHGLELSRATRVAHATTLFTNALIERRGAVTGLLMTAGFSDTLQIGRERKYDLYDLAIERPTPLVPRNLCADVAERVHADGSVAVPLDEEDLLGAARRLVEAGATSLALVFLHSFAHPAHERRAAELLLEAFPGVEVTISSEVAAQIREYERASTTAVNASIKPLAGLYLEGMRDRLVELGVDAPLHLLLSNGGLSDVAEAKRVPARLLESGPAAGAIAAAHFGAADGGGDLLAFDMGGTTAKLCCIEGGEPAIAFGFEAARERRFVPGSGLPVQISAIDLIEIGAGGGSIARVDRLGLLKVGPQSAGSEPGPAAYGRGGTEPTVTDADFLLGSLDPASFAGGGFGIDMTAAEAAVGRLAETLGLSLVETAAGIRDVVEEQMAAAARMHLAERGVDASRFALLATGGAGPVHADGLARKLGLRRVICPPSAGVASALGLLLAPARADRVATVAAAVDTCDLAALEAAFAALEAEARDVVAATGADPASATVERLADGRFAGQGFEFTIPLPPGPYGAEAIRERFRDAFLTAYRERYAFAPPALDIEFTNIRTVVRAGEPAVRGLAGSAPGDARPVRERPVHFREAGGFVPTLVMWREALAPGAAFDGPAVVEEAGSTLIIGPGARARVSAEGNIVVDLPGGAP